jgi:hypothetical protein
VPRSALLVAFVTEYERAGDLAATLEERLRKLEGYRVQSDTLAGQRVLALRAPGDERCLPRDTGRDGSRGSTTAGDRCPGAERWVFWPSARWIVKVGGPEVGEIPAAVARAYLDVYPSDLKEVR